MRKAYSISEFSQSQLDAVARGLPYVVEADSAAAAVAKLSRRLGRQLDRYEVLPVAGLMVSTKFSNGPYRWVVEAGQRMLDYLDYCERLQYPHPVADTVDTFRHALGQAGDAYPAPVKGEK